MQFKKIIAVALCCSATTMLATSTDPVHHTQSRKLEVALVPARNLLLAILVRNTFRYVPAPWENHQFYKELSKNNTRGVLDKKSKQSSRYSTKNGKNNHR